MDERQYKKLIKDIRTAFADYVCSEGCSCCEGSDHGAHEKRIAELLKIKRHDDKSGYNYSKYRSKQQDKR